MANLHQRRWTRRCTWSFGTPGCHGGIHGGTPTDADYREKLREQNAFSEEIATVIATNTVGNEVDEYDLEQELEDLQQEKLDEDMLKTGVPPSADAVHKLPTPATAERESHSFCPPPIWRL